MTATAAAADLGSAPTPWQQGSDECRLCMQFLAGLGLGGTALLRGVSGWGLSSMAGFSSAAARALRRSITGPGEHYASWALSRHLCDTGSDCAALGQSCC